MVFCDSHIHLTHSLYEGVVPCIAGSDNPEPIRYMNLEQMMNAFAENGIVFCIEPGIELESNYKILELANLHPGFVYPAIGVHPTRSFQTKWSKRKELAALMKDSKVVAVGELGLDYHYKRLQQHRLKQKVWFCWQLKQAHERKLPLILHIREADRDAIKILRHFKNRLHGGVCHCFDGDTDLANIYTKEFGFLLGIGGSLLQKDACKLEQAVLQTPLEYLILETDGPYVKPLKPEGVSGKKWKKARNSSLIIPEVAQRIAELKHIDVSEVEKTTTENVIRLFKL